MRIVIGTLLLLLVSYIKVSAQSSCERNLNEARADYASGNLYAVPGKLGDCLEDGFNKVEKIEALRLLTLTYININQQEKARATLIKLLNLQTDYRVVESVDPPELYSLYTKIDTDIKYFVGVTFGVSVNNIIIHFDRNTYPFEENPGKYKRGWSFPQAGVQFLYPIKKSLIAGAEIQYQPQRYSYSEAVDYDDERISNISYESRNEGINLNLVLRYMKDYYEWKPFVEVGAVGRANLNYQMVTYVNNFEFTTDDEIINGADISADRVKLNLALSMNLGTMIKLGQNYGEVKFGVSNYFRNHLTPEARAEVYRSSVLDAMALKPNDITNLVFQLNFTFNIPFFNFQ